MNDKVTIFTPKQWVHAVWFRNRHPWRDYKLEWCVFVVAVAGVILGFFSVEFLRERASGSGLPRLAALIASTAAILGVFGETIDHRKYTWRLTPWGVSILAVLLVGTRVAMAEVEHTDAEAKKAQTKAEQEWNKIMGSFDDVKKLNEDATKRLTELKTMLGGVDVPNSTLGRISGLRRLIGPPDGSADDTVFSQLHELDQRLSQLPGAKELAREVTKKSGEFAQGLSAGLSGPLTAAASAAKPQVSEPTLLAALNKAPLVKKEDVVDLAGKLKVEVPAATLTDALKQYPQPLSQEMLTQIVKEALASGQPEHDEGTVPPDGG